MSFGDDLSKYFDLLTSGMILGEVALFNKLMDSFIILSSSLPMYRIDHMHSKNGMVKYENSSGTLIATPTGVSTYLGKTDDITGIGPNGVEIECEISDLAFIIYSKKGVKISFMQNKYDKSFNISDKKFHVDVDQLGLLKGKPKFITSSSSSNVAKITWPSILYNATIPSVGSYGVFYKKNKHYNMFYCPADLIEYIKKKITRGFNPMKKRYKKVSNKVVRFDNSSCPSVIPGTNNRYVGTHIDCTCAYTIKEFGDELINFHIGTILSSQDLKVLEVLLIKNGGEDILKRIKEVYNNFVGSKIDEHKFITESEDSFLRAKNYVFIEALLDNEENCKGDSIISRQ